MTHPVEHRSSNIITDQQLGTFPLKSEVRVEDLALPVRCISQFIYHDQHLQLSERVAKASGKNVSTVESTWRGRSLRIFRAVECGEEQSILIWLKKRLPPSTLHFWPLQRKSKSWDRPASLLSRRHHRF